MSDHLPECTYAECSCTGDFTWQTLSECHEAPCICPQLRSYGERLTAAHLAAVLQQAELGGITVGSAAVARLAIEDVHL